MNPRLDLKNIFIIGDSFCAYRTDVSKHWPAKLAELCNLKLLGAGYEGHSWWTIRKNLLKFLESKDFQSTELFVFCHSEPNRIIGNDDFKIDSQVEKIYLTYLENKDFNHWCMTQWFKELNDILDGKNVVHIQGFNTTKRYFSMLNGLKVITPLMNLSLEEPGYKFESFMNDARNNHFSDSNNMKLADVLFEFYQENFKNNNIVNKQVRIDSWT